MPLSSPLESRFRLIYPAAGFAFSLATVAALAVFRTQTLRGGLTPALIVAELGQEAPTYGFLTLAVFIGIATWGVVAGWRLDRLLVEAFTDTVSGLGNRRYFDKRLRLEVGRASRRSQPLSLILVELDRSWRPAGPQPLQDADSAMRTLAYGIRRACRPSDIAARYGNMALAVLTPGADRTGALAVANQIRSVFTRYASMGRTTTATPPPLLSMGVAELAQLSAPSPDRLLAAADAALATAHASGSDRAVVTPQPRRSAPSMAAASAAPAVPEPPPQHPQDTPDTPAPVGA